MREIKFRGKSKDENKWFYGGGIIKVEHNTYDTGKIELAQSVNYDELDYFCPSYDTEDVIPETVGQYTRT